MKYIFTIVSMIIFWQAGISQHLIRGRVIDKLADKSIAAVSIINVSQNISAISDENGYFEMSAEGDSISLKLRHFEFEDTVVTVYLPIPELRLFSMQRKLYELEEVEINTGYQQIPKERSTGAFSFVGSNRLQQIVSVDLMERLPVLANGVLMSRGTSSPQLMVRGLSTINGPKSPLIVLDNFPYEGDINDINPNIIQNVTILKDAAATSIWGARAANGVIVLTTKRSSIGEDVVIDFSANVSHTGTPKLNNLKLISSANFIDLERELFDRGFYDRDITSQSHPVLSPVVELLNSYRKNEISAEYMHNELGRLKSIDSRDQYRKYMYRSALNQQYSINISGSSGKNSWISSVAYDNNIGNIHNKYSRLNARLQNSWEPMKSIKISNSIYFIRTEDQSGRLGFGEIKMKNSAVPYMEFADDSGNPISVPIVYSQNYKDSVAAQGLLDWNYYPLNDWQYNKSKSINSELLFSTDVRYSILKGLNAEVKYQYQSGTRTVDQLYGEDSFYARNYINQFAQADQNGAISYIVPPGGIVDKSTYHTIQNNLRGQINYQGTFGKSAVNAIIGSEIRSINLKNDNNRYYGYDEKNLTVGSVDYVNQYPNFVNGSLQYIQRGQSLVQRSTNYLSQYANLAYTYVDKYTLSGSLRRDASNLFGLKTNDQWNPFWSVGAQWVLSDENFYHSIFLPSLKVRTSYGFNGNIDPAMSAVTTISYLSTNSSYTNSPTARISNYYNPSLRWENARTLNLAVDFVANNSRISGSADFFVKNADNLFGNTPIDYTAGVVSIVKNVASIQAKGWDFMINSRNLEGKINWNSTLNLSIYHEKVKSYYLSNMAVRNFILPGSSAFITGLENLPVYSVLGFKSAGLDPDNGDPMGYLNGSVSKDYNEMMNAEFSSSGDIKVFGSAIPTYYGSMINSFVFKNFQIDIGISYKLGYWFRRNSIDYTSLFLNWLGHSDYEQRWQKPGDEKSTIVPSNPLQSNTSRDAFYNGTADLVERGDHIRLQYMNISYDLKKLLRTNNILKQCVLVFNINNGGIIWRANKSEIDPDYNSDGYSLQPAKTFSLSIRTKF